jgi:predicted DNA-binding transcriptional regulator AlpA
MTSGTCETFADLLTVAQLARYLQISEDWLNAQRCKGTGPPYTKLGRNVRYLKSEVDAWLKVQSRRSTSEASR